MEAVPVVCTQPQSCTHKNTRHWIELKVTDSSLNKAAAKKTEDTD